MLGSIGQKEGTTLNIKMKKIRIFVIYKGLISYSLLNMIRDEIPF